MYISHILAAGRSAATDICPNQFVRRLVVAIFVTLLDAAVVLSSGRYIYQAFAVDRWLVPTSCVTLSALTASLAHLWIMTFRARRCTRPVQMLLNFSERRKP